MECLHILAYNGKLVYGSGGIRSKFSTATGLTIKLSEIVDLERGVNLELEQLRKHKIYELRN